ncbi:hypothetical protein BDN71DRAFT_1431877 [Pleurotus eryngii]|uniref:BTB domain-containing protein n=1 Tax=Pleurotus eryngii TaxID=5323 RepID=A0A9P6DF92_PLEER|nr:hypothetical protein BDN71DRAFT_1431877 [Pleurotus eryngii]
MEFEVVTSPVGDNNPGIDYFDPTGVAEPRRTLSASIPVTHRILPDQPPLSITQDHLGYHDGERSNKASTHSIAASSNETTVAFEGISDGAERRVDRELEFDFDLALQDYIIRYYGHLWRNFGILLAFTIGRPLHETAVTLFSLSRALNPAMLKEAEAAIGDDEENDTPASRPQAATVPGESDHRQRADERKALSHTRPKMADIFSWSHVRYTIPIGNHEHRILLDDVSGYVVPDKLTALMGASGAGKTALLNVLAQRTDTGVVSGDRYVNAQSPPRLPGANRLLSTNGYACVHYYCWRSIKIFSEITAVSTADKDEYADKCLKMCGLEEFADAMVGALGVEHKKRTTIGVELAAKLSRHSIQLISVNFDVYRQQPSAELFQVVFDRLLLLQSDGKYILATLGTMLRQSSTTLRVMVQGNANLAKIRAKRLQADLDKIHTDGRQHSSVDATVSSSHAASFAYQLTELTIRQYVSYWRNPAYLMSKFTLNIAAGLFIGTSTIDRQPVSFTNASYKGFSFFNAGDSQQDTQNKLFILVEIPWNIFDSTLFYFCWYWTVGFGSSRAGYTCLIFETLGQAFSAIGHQDIVCSEKEIAIVNPPSGNTCAQYFQSYNATNGGYLNNPDAASTCQFCSNTSEGPLTFSTHIDGGTSAHSAPTFCLIPSRPIHSRICSASIPAACWVPSGKEFVSKHDIDPPKLRILSPGPRLAWTARQEYISTSQLDLCLEGDGVDEDTKNIKHSPSALPQLRDCMAYDTSPFWLRVAVTMLYLVDFSFSEKDVSMSKDPQELGLDTPTTVVAPSEPFDDEGADIILRSCDGTDFRVYKAILTLASPVFRDMFSLPDSPKTNEDHNGIRIVQMQEPSSTLDPLLRFSYPIESPKICTKDLFVSVMSAAAKFEMKRLFEKIIDSHITPGTISKSPFEYYAFAQRLQLRQLTMDSARKCLDLPLATVFKHVQNIDFQHISVKNYNRFLCYWTECQKACLKLVDHSGHSNDPYDFRWVPNNHDYMFRARSSCDGNNRTSVCMYTDGPFGRTVNMGRKKWWFDHVDRIARGLMAHGPGVLNTIDVSQPLADVAAESCNTCRIGANRDLSNFSAALAKQVEIEIGKQPTKPPFGYRELTFPDTGSHPLNRKVSIRVNFELSQFSAIFSVFLGTFLVFFEAWKRSVACSLSTSGWILPVLEGLGRYLLFPCSFYSYIPGPGFLDLGVWEEKTGLAAAGDKHWGSGEVVDQGEAAEKSYLPGLSIQSVCQLLDPLGLDCFHSTVCRERVNLLLKWLHY